MGLFTGLSDAGFARLREDMREWLLQNCPLIGTALTEAFKVAANEVVSQICDIGLAYCGASTSGDQASVVRPDCADATPPPPLRASASARVAFVDDKLSACGAIHDCGDQGAPRACYEYDPPATLRALYFNKGGGGVRTLPTYEGFSKGKSADCSKHYTTNARGLHPGIYDFNVRSRLVSVCCASARPRVTSGSSKVCF